MNKMAKI